MPENDPSSPSLLAPLLTACTGQFSQLKSHFEATGDGAAVLQLRSARVDSILQDLYSATMAPQRLPEPAAEGPEGFCLAAVGGYGRVELFPFSDLDLLFAARDERILKSMRESMAAFARTLWDLQMRVFHTARTIEDCGHLHGGNLEFSVSLLDIRYVAGDRVLFDELRCQAIPHLVARDGQDLARNLIDHTSERHAKHGKTIFHLEPDVKEAPGGLRDYQVARWLAVIAEMASRAHLAQAEDLWPPKARQPVEDAVQFLSAVRCFLHFQQGRNDNLLTYELHERAARLGLGVHYGEPVDPAQWMRDYYRHVRSIQRLATLAMESVRPSRSSLYGLFQDWRSRLSNADFAVIRGRIFPRSQGPADWPLLLSLFEMMARHSLDLSREAERWAEETLAALRPEGAESRGTDQEAVWPALRKALTLPGAADALRAMHRLGLLTALLPEFRAIDSLVIRDFYHRYTVDEHTFMTVQTLCELKRAAQEGSSGADESLAPWRKKFGEIYAELERPEVLALALLLHDVGKGMAAASHVEGSVEVARSVCARLGLDSGDVESVIFLIGSHLEMSSTVSRRDIFDPETLRAFAQKTGTTERLKMLCLMTYADINAVNPEAMTPWKAEMLWQLYAMTENYFSRSVDQDRLAARSEAVAQAIPVAEGGAGDLETFLSGFPRRYLAAHSPSEVGEHFAWARKTSQNPVTVKVKRREAFSELTVLAMDRPFLFASVSGTLAAWGMNILKAEAFANGSGIVLDIFRFHDLHRTLELNPPEIKRLEESIEQVLAGNTSVDMLMRGRMNPRGAPRSKIKTPTQVSFDDASSSRCTILELAAEDHPGLLYQVSATLADLGCNIEVALIETEAQKALDVFYLTANGAKLTSELQRAIRSALLQKLARS
ncbi:MAG: [protein-PII] uridylyltransferase [Terriglobia bacterium]